MPGDPHLYGPEPRGVRRCSTPGGGRLHPVRGDGAAGLCEGRAAVQRAHLRQARASSLGPRAVIIPPTGTQDAGPPTARAPSQAELPPPPLPSLQGWPLARRAYEPLPEGGPARGHGRGRGGVTQAHKRPRSGPPKGAIR
eukprot:scaffold722_cov255-Prasinococcus_capsulatus_cf.AAC.10